MRWRCKPVSWLNFAVWLSGPTLTLAIVCLLYIGARALLVGCRV